MPLLTITSDFQKLVSNTKGGTAVGPTVDGKKPILIATNEEKGQILRKIKQQWQKRIKLHFGSQGSLRVDGKVLKWKPLNTEYIEFKEDKNLLTGILRASSPTLEQRYLNSISYNSKTFNIFITFPELVTGPSRSKQGATIDASVHQPRPLSNLDDIDEEEIIDNIGRIKRPIFKKTFREVARQVTVDYFTK